MTHSSNCTGLLIRSPLFIGFPLESTGIRDRLNTVDLPLGTPIRNSTGRTLIALVFMLPNIASDNYEVSFDIARYLRKADTLD